MGLWPLSETRDDKSSSILTMTISNIDDTKQTEMSGSDSSSGSDKADELYLMTANESLSLFPEEADTNDDTAVKHEKKHRGAGCQKRSQLPSRLRIFDHTDASSLQQSDASSLQESQRRNVGAPLPWRTWSPPGIPPPPPVVTVSPWGLREVGSDDTDDSDDTVVFFAWM